MLLFFIKNAVLNLKYTADFYKIAYYFFLFGTLSILSLLYMDYNHAGWAFYVIGTNPDTAFSYYKNDSFPDFKCMKEPQLDIPYVEMPPEGRPIVYHLPPKVMENIAAGLFGLFGGSIILGIIQQHYNLPYY